MEKMKDSIKYYNMCYECMLVIIPILWEDYLHLVEFTYNNHYQTSTKLSPFEILYGRKCNTRFTWSNPVDRLMLGPNMLKE